MFNNKNSVHPLTLTCSIPNASHGTSHTRAARDPHSSGRRPRAARHRLEAANSARGEPKIASWPPVYHANGSWRVPTRHRMARRAQATPVRAAAANQPQQRRPASTGRAPDAQRDGGPACEPCAALPRCAPWLLKEAALALGPASCPMSLQLAHPRSTARPRPRRSRRRRRRAQTAPTLHPPRPYSFWACVCAVPSLFFRLANPCELLQHTMGQQRIRSGFVVHCALGVALRGCAMMRHTMVPRGREPSTTRRSSAHRGHRPYWKSRGAEL